MNESTWQLLSLVNNLWYVALSGSFHRRAEVLVLSGQVHEEFFGHFLKLGKRYKGAGIAFRKENGTLVRSFLLALSAQILHGCHRRES